MGKPNSSRQKGFLTAEAQSPGFDNKAESTRGLPAATDTQALQKE
jgi:hypothetical protein